MIITRLLGGLGNQLFQYAAGRALAARHGTRLLLDIAAFDAYPLRRYRLDRFEIDADVLSVQERASLRIGIPVRGGVRGAADRLFRAPRVPELRERQFEFDAELWAGAPRRCLLDGYWQSPRYFENVAEAIRREVRVRAPMDEVNRAVAGRIAATTSVSVHVRRGDYVANAATNRYHGVCGPEYYAAAEKWLADRVGPLHLFVFSDDPEWAEANLRFASPTSVLRHNDAEQDHEDLRLMTGCRHHVIANSTFSWWGAWLSPHPDKTVIAPRRWFGEAAHDTSDLVPREWVRL
jgi:Glycosyl transferase family 11